MMKVLLDTNVLLDILIESRPLSAVSSTLLRIAKKGEIEAVATTQSIIDASYVYVERVKRPILQFKESVAVLMSAVTLNSINQGNIKAAVVGPMEDFEDAAQIDCAIESGCDAIISSDKKLKENGRVAVFTPTEILVRLFGE